MAGISDGEFTIRQDQGLSYAIAEELNLTELQCKKVNWKSVFELVKEARNTDGNNVNWGGEDDLYGGKGSYVVNAGDVFKFSKEIWNRIVDTVVNSLNQKGIGTDNINLAKTEEVTPPASTEKAPEQPVPSKPSEMSDHYDESYRFEPREVDKSKTERILKKILGIETNNRIVRKYDKNGILISEAVERGDTSIKEITYYDADGKKTDKYTFNKDGNISSRRIFNVKNGMYVERNNDGTVNVTEYDAETSKATKSTKYNTDGTVTVTDYDADEKPVKETVSKYDL